MYKDTLQPGFMYHVYNKGNNQENLFKQEQNYNYFLLLWKKHILPIADTFCYTLLPNHFHFLIETKGAAPSKIISQSFSNCFNAYSKSINKAYHRNGSLFQERFGRKLVETTNYFTEIIFYIHSNAKKHGLTEDFTRYPYSSYQSILSYKPTLLCRDRVLDFFGGRQSFVNFHQTYKELSAYYLNGLTI